MIVPIVRLSIDVIWAEFVLLKNGYLERKNKNLYLPYVGVILQCSRSSEK